MLTFLKAAVDDGSADRRGKIGAIYAVLLTANALVWAWAVIALAGRPTLLGTAFLAYGLFCLFPWQHEKVEDILDIWISACEC